MRLLATYLTSEIEKLDVIMKSVTLGGGGQGEGYRPKELRRSSRPKELRRSSQPKELRRSSSITENRMRSNRICKDIIVLL